MTSVLSVIIGGAAGIIKFLITKHFDFKQQEKEAWMQAAGIRLKSQNRAGKISDKGISFTRRLLALIFAAALTTPVFYGLIYPDATISVPETYLKKGIWDYILPWKEGKEMVKYVEIKAPVLAMPVYDICAMIVGFYFGSGGSRAR